MEALGYDSLWVSDLLETRLQDLDDTVGIYETFAREIRSKL